MPAKVVQIREIVYTSYSMAAVPHDGRRQCEQHMEV